MSILSDKCQTAFDLMKDYVIQDWFTPFFVSQPATLVSFLKGLIKRWDVNAYEGSITFFGRTGLAGLAFVSIFWVLIHTINWQYTTATVYTTVLRVAH